MLNHLIRFMCLSGVCSAQFLFAADSSAVQADHKLAEALSKNDNKAVGELLSRDFSWTDSAGKTDSATTFSGPALAMSLTAEAQPHDYGSVTYFTGVSGASGARHRFVRVWVDEQGNSKLLLFEETKLVGQVATPQATVPFGTACQNPCKSIPYDAPSPEAKAVVESWEALEDAVNHRDAEGWAAHVADEFVFNVKEDGNPLTKADRVKIIRKQAEGSTVTDIGTVIPGTMKVWVYGATAVMTDEQQPTMGGNPYRAMRIWVKRDGRWQLVYSQQTVIER